MNRHAIVFLALTLPLGAVKAPSPSPGLPEWTEEDRKALAEGTLRPGAALLAQGDEAPEGVAPTEEEPPSAEEIAPRESESDEVPERFLDDYFGRPPVGFLVDPQALLDVKAAKDRSEFLRYHGGDSGIDLYVYLFGGDQDIPSGVRHEELAERFFSSGKPAAVVLYFLGSPQRSLIQLSPSLGDSVTAAEQQSALTNSVGEALAKADPIEQLEAFCVRMSIRLYWMERAAGLANGVPSPAVEEPGSAPLEAGVPGSERLEERFSEWADLWLAPVGVVGGTLAVSGIGWWLARSRRRFRFPEFEVSPRLGGGHGAGVGAVLSFGSTSQSPASQRREVPDYLAGI